MADGNLNRDDLLALRAQRSEDIVRLDARINDARTREDFAEQNRLGEELIVAKQEMQALDARLADPKSFDTEIRQPEPAQQIEEHGEAQEERRQLAESAADAVKAAQDHIDYVNDLGSNTNVEVGVPQKVDEIHQEATGAVDVGVGLAVVGVAAAMAVQQTYEAAKDNLTRSSDEEIGQLVDQNQSSEKSLQEYRDWEEIRTADGERRPPKFDLPPAEIEAPSTEAKTSKFPDLPPQQIENRDEQAGPKFPDAPTAPSSPSPPELSGPDRDDDRR